MLSKKPETQMPTFRECIGEIEKSGHTLRQALLARNADAIWKAIARQEESLNHFRLCQARTAAKADGARPDHPDTFGLDPLSLEMMKRTRSVIRTNRALASTCLNIIDKTLASIASGNSGGPIAYNQAGKIDSFSTPLLVQQRG